MPFATSLTGSGTKSQQHLSLLLLHAPAALVVQRTQYATKVLLKCLSATSLSTLSWAFGAAGERELDRFRLFQLRLRCPWTTGWWCRSQTDLQVFAQGAKHCWH